ncbi:MAG: 4Fe-4S ferredoxin, partial [Actinobacteria bacterium]
MPSFPGEYVLTEIEPSALSMSVKPKQFLHIDQSECIM